LSVARIRDSVKKSLKNVIRAFNKFTGRHERQVRGEMLKIALEIKEESLEVAPMEFGPLRDSAYADIEERKNGPVVRVGYTADYAPFVHEMPETNNFTTPGTGPKFLEKVVTEGRREILNKLRGELKF